MCDGSSLKNANSVNSKAYCEGMAYRTTGLQPDVPITDNPHAAGSDAANAWDKGWTVADAHSGDAGGIKASAAGCCAVVGLLVPA